MKRLSALAVMVALAIFAVPAQHAHATSTVDVFVQCGTNPIVPCGQFSDRVFSPIGPIQLNSPTFSPGPPGPLSGSFGAGAFATEGRLGAVASSVAGAEPSFTLGANSVGGVATARSSWGERLVITAPGMVGLPGTLEPFPLSLSGSATGGVNPPAPLPTGSSATLRAFARVIGTGLPCVVDPVFGGCVGGFTLVQTDPSGGIVTAADLSGLSRVSIPFFFGGQTLIEYTLDVEAGANVGSQRTPQSASAVSDFMSTLRWGGISRVLDASGNPITTFTVTSDSGFDYVGRPAAPVPEPSTLALLGTGLPVLLLHGWRRCRSR